MALIRLTSTQVAAVDALVEARRIESVPADPVRSSAFLTAAAERLDQIPLLTSAAVKYGIAYDAAHDVGEALLAAYGYRTVNGPGQHEAIGRYLRAIVDQPPADQFARHFERMRRDRNRDRYQARPIGANAADKADHTANQLLAAAVERGVGS